VPLYFSPPLQLLAGRKQVIFIRTSPKARALILFIFSANTGIRPM